MPSPSARVFYVFPSALSAGVGVYLCLSTHKGRVLPSAFLDFLTKEREVGR